jgi:signal transduction histidine kinase/ligand-binding sensor domain-containing protein
LLFSIKGLNKVDIPDARTAEFFNVILKICLIYVNNKLCRLKMKIRKYIFFLEILVFAMLNFITQSLYGHETGFKYLKNYSYKEYDHQAQNWGMVQAENGIIYVANNGGVLEFDGVSWRVIGIPNYDTVRSIAVDNFGTVFIGGNNKFGYLALDSNGTLKYESLVNHLGNNEKNFSNVWSTHATKKGIYFRTTNFLFRWDYKEIKIKVWSTPNSFKNSFVCNGDFILQQEKVGIIKVVNDSFKLVPGGETFADEKIWMMVPYDSERNSRTLLIGTRSKGFYLYDGRKFVSFPTEVDNYLKKNRSYRGIRLSSGDFALATLLGGLVIMDAHGRIKYIFDKTYGLQDDKVHYVFEDIQGNLWLCLDNGISKIEYVSPISINDERSHLSGLVLSAVKHDKDLYVGTTNGLYYLESPLKFNLIPGISSSCWSLISIDHSILAAATDGVFQVDDNKNIKRKVIKDVSFVLLPSKRYPGRTWCGTDKGLIALYQEKGHWIEDLRFKTINHEIRYLVEDKSGNLWLVTSTGGVLKVDFSVDINNPVVTWYETSHGLPGGRVYATEAAGHVMFATEKGIFRFDEEKKVFIPDRTMGDEFAGGSDSKDVFRIAEDKNKNIWFNSQSRNFQAIPEPRGNFTIRSRPFRRIPKIQVNAIYPDPDGKITWFASFDGLIRYDSTVEKNYQQQFQTLIRRVLINENQEDERQIFDGCVIKSKTYKAGKPLFPVIKYRDRNLYFEFAAPFFEVETETRYQCFLDGYDSDWSVWSKTTKKNYTNLDPGMYSFRVRARNIYHHLGKEDAFKFKILPPWYRTWWAFLLYVIVFILTLFFIVKWRSGKLKWEKQRLEQIVTERVKEINEKHQQLKNTQDQLIQAEKLSSLGTLLAGIAHELFNPAGTIMLNAEWFSKAWKDIAPLLDRLDADSKLIIANLPYNESREEIEKLISGLLDSSRRIKNLLEELKKISRKEDGTNKETVDIHTVIRSAVHLTQNLIKKSTDNFTLDFGENIPGFQGNSQRLIQVFINLVRNACEALPANNRCITISTSYHKKTNEILIQVKDEGEGIEEQNLSKITDPFFTTRRNSGGMGLGLSISRQIIQDEHQGRMVFDSTPGQGTTVLVYLPVKPFDEKINNEIVL